MVITVPCLQMGGMKRAEHRTVHVISDLFYTVGGMNPRQCVALKTSSSGSSWKTFDVPRGTLTRGPATERD
jgi:hypothetical protein